MATYLRVNPNFDPATGSMTGANWKLPDGADIGELAGQLSDLLAGSGSLTVVIETGTPDAPQGGMIFLNGEQISLVSLVTIPD